MSHLLEIDPDDVSNVSAAPLLDIEPDPAPAPMLAAGEVTPALVSMGLIEVLDKDFPLPALIRFCPNPTLKAALNQAAAYALGVDVAGAEGLQRADLALTALSESQKAIEAHFEEPTKIANDLHKRLTSLRGEWLDPGAKAKKTVGDRMWTERRRLEADAAKERRKAQEEADRQERERLAAEAKAAAQAQAPRAVVEELQTRAQWATAAPVPVVPVVPAMAGTTTVTTWKARLASTPADAEPNPAMAELTPAQRADVLTLLKAILAGQAPLALLDISWTALNARAKAEKSTLAIPGVVAFEQGSVRQKSTRGRS